MATFFEHFTPQEVARISGAGRRVKLPEGWSPIWEDTPADKAYIILDGTVSVRRDGAEVAQLGPGDIVGEAAIVGHKLRNATVVALTPLDTIHLTDATVRQLDAEMPSFHQALVEVAQARMGG
ncbi:cyclic nucleotide-binding domain-containing protein [Nocardioides sp. TF02-7]|uniref:Crp/Fnr family transcriptional regulator n=1 Tax=Nocardioides sp. TF02-7 TaxID=2917724 RepID=UPI001F05B47C|nr:cyclic nucleotide-binding domain-containing protein [Nocardioides sp. TF02-7]UMG94371.1 cyclic nucleotide-binding domain-containing protein [Nocardioides sp. TF02-7]